MPDHNYHSLNQDFINAIQKGQLSDFIQRMNNILRNQPTRYLIWLFVARAYDAQGDVESAANSFTHLLRLSKSSNPNATQLLKEVKDFVRRNKRYELVKVAEERYGVGCLNLTIPHHFIKSPVHNSSNFSSVEAVKEKGKKIAKDSQQKK